MPAVIAFKGVSINRFIGQITMSTEGIYGVPLDVSAQIVFLFVLFGAMLDKAGAGKYFVDLAFSLLGNFKGGPAKAAVLASGLTGMVSGSSIANVVTTGTFTIPLMFLIFELVVLRHSAQLAAFRAIVALAVIIPIQNLITAKRHNMTNTGALKKSVMQIGDALVSGARNMMGIGVAVASAGIIVGVVTLGLGLPTTANYIVMASLTAPVIVVLGAKSGFVFPLIAAHLFVFFFGILADDTPPVGLAAFAAAAIAKSNPIKTGIQGFTYDIRTAILPFMFIFNTDLLLIGIHSVWMVGWIFLTSIIAMFAFAALTQGYFTQKNKWYEGILLGLVAFTLLRPNLMGSFLNISDKYPGRFPGVIASLVAMGIYAAIYIMQSPRKKAEQAAA